MAKSTWVRWFHSFFRSKGAAPLQRRPRRMSLEHLETRVVPTTFIWTGAGNGNWNSGANWQGLSAPTGIASNFENLVFPANATSKTSTDNIANGAFNSIEISGSNYTIAGPTATLTLGNPALAGASYGYIIADSGAQNDLISIKTITLGGAPGTEQVFTVNPNATLTINSNISGNVGLTKAGAGTLVLGGNNNKFAGPVEIQSSGGVLQITTSSALGNATQTTTVGTNAQLQVNITATNGDVTEPIILNGQGPNGTGALYIAAGTSIWADTVELDSDSYIGAAGILGGTVASLDITGVISDTGSGHNITKVGNGTVAFAGANTYRGTTTVNDGILDLENNDALGVYNGSPSAGAIVNSSLTGSGTLRLNSTTGLPTGSPITIANELLTLNGPGYTGLGALDNANSTMLAPNLWTGNVTLGSPAPLGSNVSIGSESFASGAPSNLEIDGMIGDLPNAAQQGGPYNLSKVNTGEVTLTANNSYLGSTTIYDGILNIEDSGALGPTKSLANPTIVYSGGALWVSIDNNADSSTKVVNEKNVNQPLEIQGTGPLGASPYVTTGALRSVSGINIWSGNIYLLNSDALPLATPATPLNNPPLTPITDSIGVAPDPHPSSTSQYFTNDYHLTIAGKIESVTAPVGPGPGPVGPSPVGATTAGNEVLAPDIVIPLNYYSVPTTPVYETTFEKDDTGQLILSGSNEYTAPTIINAGWITAQNDFSLGQLVAGLGATEQPLVTVKTGAALHLKALTPSGSVTLHSNVLLMGTGITHPDSAISKKGALMGIGGTTAVQGIIQLNGQVGIGVEVVDPNNFPTSNLYLQGTVEDAPTTTGDGIIKLGSQRLYIQGSGSYTGSLDIHQGVVQIDNNTALGLGTGAATIETGTSLEIGGTDATPQLDGGVVGGIEIWNTSLIVNGTGDAGIGDNGPIVNVSDDNIWRGSGTINLNNSIAIDVMANTRLALDENIIDTGNLSAAGSGLTADDAGELVLGGTNTYRGTTTIDTNSIVTIESDQALGAASGTNSGQVVVQNGGQLQVQGGITVAGKTLVLQGSGVATTEMTTPTWFSDGPAPLTGGDQPGGGSSSGRVTGLAVDPTDPNTIYAAEAGGGLWKTTDGGKTWLPLFDNTPTPVTGTNASMFSGAVAVDPANPRIIIYGTGESNNSNDSFYGTGVYISLDAGLTWNLVVDASAGNFNPFAGMVISKIVVDPYDPDTLANLNAAPVFYVADGNQGVTEGATTNTPGVWRYDANAPSGQQWFNTTDQMSAQRVKGKIATPGPDDDFKMAFPQSSATWSDLAIYYDTYGHGSILYAALGSPNAYYFLNNDLPIPKPVVYPYENAVFRMPLDQEWYAGTPNQEEDPLNPVDGDDVFEGPYWTAGVQPFTGEKFPGYSYANPVWFVGNGYIDDRVFKPDNSLDVNYGLEQNVNSAGGEFPSPASVGGRVDNGTISIAVSDPTPQGMYVNEDVSGTILFDPSSPYLSFGFTGLTVYAADSRVDNNPNNKGNGDALGVQSDQETLEVDVSTAGGTGWTATTPPNYMGGPYLQLHEGNYANAIVADPTNSMNVFVAGSTNAATGADGVLASTNGGTAWTTDITSSGGSGPHTNAHAFVWDGKTALLGTDGGVWQLNSPGVGNSWTDINGNLDTLLLNSVAVSPTNPDLIYGASQDNGTVTTTTTFTGVPSPSWAQISNGVSGAVAVNPDNPNIVYTTVDGYTPSIAASEGYVYNSGVGSTPISGVDSNNQENNFDGFTEPNTLDGFVEVSTSGGAPGSFSPILTVPGETTFPMVLDPQNPNRIVVGGQDISWQTVPIGNPPIPTNPYSPVLEESLDGGQTWIDLSANLDLGSTPAVPALGYLGGTKTIPFLPASDQGSAVFDVTDVALAQYQGNFQPDPRFPLVNDAGANTYVPNTMYVVGYDTVAFQNLNDFVFPTPPGIDIMVTKDGGQSWFNITPPPLLTADGNFNGNDAFLKGYLNSFGAGFGPGYTPTPTAVGVTVDPTNENHVFVTQAAFSSTPGSGLVMESTDAGQTWNDFTYNLPNLPVWSSAYDARSGTLYIGNDNGVWALSNNSTTWVREGGASMPNLSVRQIVLNTNLNTLTAATYGGGAYTLFLDDTTAGGGALRAVSGNSSWTGQVVLAGPTTFGAAGSQIEQNGETFASINIVGTISDQTNTMLNTVTKVGEGNVIFSGANTYQGVTDIQQGALGAANPQALGSAVSGTTVEQGAALQLFSSVKGEPLTLKGDGLVFEGHATGALENVNNINTYSGPITLDTNATIAVDSGSALTITGAIGDGGNDLNLTKEATGLLILDDENTYGGTTYVYQGALQVQAPGALSGSSTEVLDGSQLQLFSPKGSGGLTVAGELLVLSGTGIPGVLGSGALENIAGNNAWAGPITLSGVPGFVPPTFPKGDVSIAVDGATDTLTLSGPINDVMPNGISKLGAGTLVLSGSNSYRGATYVDNGLLTIENAQALGDNNGDAMQRVTVVDTVGTFTLTFEGQTTTPLGVNVAASAVQSALEALPAIGPNGVSVESDPVAIPVPGGTLTTSVYTVTFLNFTGQAVPLMTAGVQNGALAQVSDVADEGIGAVVSSGAALDVNLDPTNTGVPQTVNGIDIQINGSGIGKTGTGAIDNVSGYNTWTGTINLATPSTIGVDGGTFNETGVVSGPTSSTLTKAGIGTLDFGAADTYGGSTLVNNGVLGVSNAFALGAPVGGVFDDGALKLTNNVQTVTINGAGTGFFTLSYKSQTTPPQIFDQTTAATLQSALNALTTIGPGGVTVMQGTGLNQNVFTIAFNGPNFAGQSASMLTSTFGNGVTSAPVQLIQQGGLGGTTVASGATLQLSGINGNTTISTDQLSIIGNGSNGIGALDSINGANTWNSPILMKGNSSIGSEAGAILTLNQPLNQLPSTTTTVTKVGAGTLLFTGNAMNTYTGTTTVADGTLQLDTNGFSAIPAALVIGQGTLSPESAVVQLLGNNQIAVASPVTVNSDGLLDLNSNTQEIGSLTITDGTAQTNTAGTLTLDSLTMTGGTLTSGGAGSSINLAGNVKATSDANGEATITGQGTFSLGTTAHTFNVSSSGLQASDLDINTVISGNAPPPPPPPALPVIPITKTGNGTLELDQANTYAGTTTVAAGFVQVDGSVGNVALSGTGGLSGNGTVGLVTGPSFSQAQGTVAPGDNGNSQNPIGILTTGSVNWGPQTIFSVDLDDATQLPGVGFDQLFVNGTVALGGAILTGNVNPLIQVGQSFVIIQTAPGGSVVGTFHEPNPLIPTEVFVNGPKFTVQYINTDPGQGDNVGEVVITRELATVTVSVHSTEVNPPGTANTTDQPSVFGQDYYFTATVTSEPGGGAIPTSDSVTFTYYINGPGTTPLTQTLNVSSNGQVIFDPTVFSGETTPVGISHPLFVSFNGDANYVAVLNQEYLPMEQPSGSEGQVVNKANVLPLTTSTQKNPPPNPTFTLSTSSPEVGQTVVATAQFLAMAPGAGIPSGTATFLVAGQQYQATLDQFGFATAALTGLPETGGSTYTITVSYSGDGNFNGLPTSPSLNFTYQADAVNFQLVPNPPSSVYGQVVQFTATVGSAGVSAATPAGTVTVTLTSLTGAVTNLPPGTLTPIGNGLASVTISAPATLAVGTYTVKATYTSTNNFSNATVQLSSFAVNLDGTTTTVTSSANPSPPGMPVTLTATVAMVSPATGTPAGLVQFVVDGNNFGNTIPLNTLGMASIIANLPAGTHAIVAKYFGNTTTAASSGSFSLGVFNGTLTTLTSADPKEPSLTNTANSGDPVTFTATVTSSLGTPTGTVDFYVDNVKEQSSSLSSTGTATFTTSTLSVGGHTIIANYDGTSSFNASSSTGLTEEVRALTTTTLTGPSANSTYGTNVTLSVTVTPKSSTGTPTGGIAFVIDGAAQSPVPLTNGQYVLNTTTLSAGKHNISVNYLGDPSFAESTSSTIQVTVNPVSTTTTLVPSVNPGGQGLAVSFTATVVAQTTGGMVPNGTVKFVFGDGSSQTVNVVGGQAVGTHAYSSQNNFQVTATYLPPTTPPIDFNTSTSATLIETIHNAANIKLTSSSGTASISPGQSVTFTAKVTAGTGNGTPTGTVTFFVDGGAAQTSNLVGGVATFTTSALTLGSHSVVAVYNGDTRFGINSSATLTENVNLASTTTIGTSNPSIASGNPVTFTANVAPKSGSGATPTGTVSFYINNGAKASFTATLDASGIATWSPTSLPLGNITITAKYSGDGTYGPSSQSLIEKVKSPATRLVAAQSSIGVSVGTPFNVTVSAYNGAQFASMDNDPVHIVVVAPAGGSVTGNLSTHFVNGSVTFQGLTLTKGGKYTLRIISDGLEVDVTVSTSSREG